MKPHTTLVGLGNSTLVGNGMYYEEGYVQSPANRSAIYPDFAPDFSCLFDTYQVKCIPGSEQECPKPQFGNNEDSTCFPKTLVNGELLCNGRT